MIVLSCFSDLTNKKTKIVNFFRNISYKNKLSKVIIKLIDSSAMDALKREKENDEFFIALIQLRQKVKSVVSKEGKFLR